MGRMRAILCAAAIVCASLGSYGSTQPRWDKDHGLWASEEIVLTRDGAWADGAYVKGDASNRVAFLQQAAGAPGDGKLRTKLRQVLQQEENREEKKRPWEGSFSDTKADEKPRSDGAVKKGTRTGGCLTQTSVMFGTRKKRDW